MTCRLDPRRSTPAGGSVLILAWGVFWLAAAQFWTGCGYHLINELNRRRQGSVTSPDRADAVLSGTIDSLSWDTVAHRGVNTAAERKVYATISLTLTDHSGKVLWKRSGLSGSQAYAVIGDNKTATEINRRQAVGVLAEQVAENVYRRLTDNF
jgi:outer membrane lipopolysaccharide assembly protein LptE/RlpB